MEGRHAPACNPLTESSAYETDGSENAGAYPVVNSPRRAQRPRKSGSQSSCDSSRRSSQSSDGSGSRRRKRSTLSRRKSQSQKSQKKSPSSNVVLDASYQNPTRRTSTHRKSGSVRFEGVPDKSPVCRQYPPTPAYIGNNNPFMHDQGPIPFDLNGSDAADAEYLVPYPGSQRGRTPRSQRTPGRQDHSSSSRRRASGSSTPGRQDRRRRASGSSTPACGNRTASASQRLASSSNSSVADEERIDQIRCTKSDDGQGYIITIPPAILAAGYYIAFVQEGEEDRPLRPKSSAPKQGFVYEDSEADCSYDEYGAPKSPALSPHRKSGQRSAKKPRKSSAVKSKGPRKSSQPMGISAAWQQSHPGWESGKYRVNVNDTDRNSAFYRNQQEIRKTPPKRAQRV